MAHVAGIETFRQEGRKCPTEQQRAEVVQFREPEGIGRKEELPQRHQLKRLAEQCCRPRADVVHDQPEVRVHEREDLGQVAGLPVVWVVVQQDHRHAGRLECPQQAGQQQWVAPVEVDVPVAVADMELDRQPLVGPAPDEEPVQHLVGQSRQRFSGPVIPASTVGAAKPARDGGDDLVITGPPPVKLKPDPVCSDRLKTNNLDPERRRGDPFTQRLPVLVGKVGGAHPGPRQ